MTTGDLALSFARRLRANADHAERSKFSVCNLSTLKIEEARALADILEAAHARKARAQEPVAEQWRAMDAEEGPRTGWTHMGLGDMRGWQKLAEQEPERFSVERRPLYDNPAPAQEPVAVPAGPDADLVQRCREIIEWHKTGLLNGGEDGGALREYAAIIYADDSYAGVRRAETATLFEAAAFVVASAAPVSTPAESGEVERLRKVVETANKAIAEYIRYLDGGEMRGSYDGKPERDGLRKAEYATRFALKQTFGGSHA